MDISCSCRRAVYNRDSFIFHSIVGYPLLLLNRMLTWTSLYPVPSSGKQMGTTIFPHRQLLLGNMWLFLPRYGLYSFTFLIHNFVAGAIGRLRSQASGFEPFLQESNTGGWSSEQTLNGKRGKACCGNHTWADNMLLVYGCRWSFQT